MNFERMLRRRQQQTTTPARPVGTGNSSVLMFFVGLFVLAIFVTMMLGYDPWNALFINPLINFLLLFNNVFFHNFGIAIVLFTIFMRLVTMPLTIRQFQSTRALRAVQPRMQEIQKKYKDPKRRQEETMKLYQEAGINPLGCLVPMLIQFPIWIALYQALRIIVGGTPESMVRLSQRLYPWSYMEQSVPLNQHFLWLNLGHADTTLVLPILVGVTTYLQQRMTSTTPTTPEQRQQQQMMNWMMPLFFVWITLAVPSGLGLYWFISNVTAVFIGYLVMGRRFDWRQMLPFSMPAPAPAARPRKQEQETRSRREREAEIVEDSVIESEPPVLGEAERRPNARRRRGKRKNR